eukprot:TRINITY_DN6249_c0_g1_i1.p1 TRINITY_DN6249_c0_g1~~TRINITY_DN6249_c0_g1_i1.p1  ORF type:complete len:381 (-),score=56.72 TRINITY_DN6249_c0_g1_i1:66-1208(-)
MPDGSSYLAWQDAQHTIHISRLELESEVQQIENDVLFENLTLAGFIARADGGGFAVAAIEGDILWVILSSKNRPTIKKQLTALIPKDQKGATFAPLEFGTLRMSAVCAGDGISGHYAVYFAAKREFSGNGKNNEHQGDSLAIIDFVSGELLDSSWAWGVSHSLDQRIVLDHSEDGYACVAIGDAYPKGVVFLRVPVRSVQAKPLEHNDLSKARWLYEADKPVAFALDANGAGWANGKLGGIVKLCSTTISESVQGIGYAVGITSAQGKQSSEVGLLRFDTEGNLLGCHWITDSPDQSKLLCKITNYGKNIFFAWRRDATLVNVQITDSNGKRLGPAVSIPSKINEGDDPVTLANGDVAWAFIKKVDGQPRIHITRFYALS